MAMQAYKDAPSLVLCPPTGPAVRHLVLTVPAGHWAQALGLLGRLDPAFGEPQPSAGQVSVGITFAGLVALQLPSRYQRVFRRLAPAFSDGAPLRRQRLGDGVAGAAGEWDPAFGIDRAHVLVSWHGEAAWAAQQAQKLEKDWIALDQAKGALTRLYAGEHLPPPPGQSGRWVHFGYRDGISEIVLPGVPKAGVLDPREHSAGELLLGQPDDSGSNRFALPRLRDKARRFFQGGSFAVFRPMAQDLGLFEARVSAWRQQMSWLDPRPGGGVSLDFVKAKLCGRWPDGRILLPGSFEPAGDEYRMDVALQADPDGAGCPFGAHARRMRPPTLGGGLVLPRPLQRRSVPFGPANWELRPEPPGTQRGLLGHFFCASIERQVEHLLGQWAARAPLGFGPGDRARDPLVGPHEFPDAALEVPITGRPLQRLEGFERWTTTLGTLYAWHPDRDAWQVLLTQDYVPVEDEEVWGHDLQRTAR